MKLSKSYLLLASCIFISGCSFLSNSHQNDTPQIEPSYEKIYIEGNDKLNTKETITEEGTTLETGIIQETGEEIEKGIKENWVDNDGIGKEGTDQNLNQINTLNTTKSTEIGNNGTSGIINEDNSKINTIIPANNMIEYENKKYNFTIKIPRNRTFQESNQGYDLRLNTPRNDEINENLLIAVQNLQKQETLKSFIDTTKKGLQDLYEDFNELKEESIKIDGVDGISLTYEATGNGLKLKSQQTVILKDNKSFIFQYTATKNSFDDYINEINNIINSFTFLD